MTVFILPLIGALVGALAYFVRRKQTHGGLIGAVFLGILGALEGGYLLPLLFNFQIHELVLVSMLLAILGAAMLIGIQYFFSTEQLAETV